MRIEDIKSLEDARAYWDSIETPVKVFLAEAATTIVPPWGDMPGGTFEDGTPFYAASNRYAEYLFIPSVTECADGTWLAECFSTFDEDDVREANTKVCLTLEEGKSFVDGLLTGMGYLLK